MSRAAAKVGWSVEISEERGVRYLHFGSHYVQGAMRIARPYTLELEYTRDLMLPLLLRDASWPATILQIGLGAASITRFLHRHRPLAKSTVVEIAPEVVAAARQFFKLPEESMQRLRVEIAEGHEYLMASKRRYDFIVVDGFDDRGHSGMLDTLPFYLNCRSHLAQDGMLAVNLLTRRRGAMPAIARMREAFDDRVLMIPPSADGNAVALAATGEAIEASVHELRLGAERTKKSTGLDLNNAVARLAMVYGGKIAL
jgi:spermidine synthase